MGCGRWSTCQGMVDGLISKQEILGILRGAEEVKGRQKFWGLPMGVFRLGLRQPLGQLVSAGRGIGCGGGWGIWWVPEG